MKIVIRELLGPEEVPVPGGESQGYRVRFSCPLGEGVAVLVPSRRKFGWKTGSELDVETSQAAIDDLKIWKNRGTMVPMLTPLEVEGDYQVRGLVSHVKDGLVYVEAAGIEFVVPYADEVASLDARAGDNIMFILHGLGLWENDA
jgi:hypothetical protein